MNREYFRKLNLSATICAEFDEPLEKGDILFDIVSHRRYEISERGFRPRRSQATADRLHWSREASFSIAGKCDEALGRVLVEESELKNPWSHLVCKIERKSGRLPCDVPIIGEFGVPEASQPAVMVITNTSVHIIGQHHYPIDTPCVFCCTDLAGTRILVSLTAVATIPFASSNRELDWSDDDTACSLV